MPEAKPAGHVGLADQVKPQQGVQGIERYRLGGVRGGCRKLGSKWVTRHSRSLQDEACFTRQKSELLGQCTSNGSRHIETCQRRVGRG